MQKRLVRLFAMLMTLALSGTACTNADDGGSTDSDATANEDSVVTVTMWWHTGQDAELAATNAAVETFNATHPNVQIVKTDIPGGEYTTQVNAAALAGDLPCVLDFDGPFVYNFVWSDYLIPLDRYVSDELRADFLPSIIDQGTYEGHLYSLGQFDSGLGLYANRSYLEAVGARIPTFEEPWTLDEFEATLAALAELPEVEFPLDMKINYGQGEWYTYGFSPILQSFGGDLIDRSDYQKASGVLDGPEAVRAMTTFQSWFENGWVDPVPSGDDSFYGTKTSAISYVGHWMWVPHSEGLGDDLLVLPMPNLGGQIVTGMGSWNYGITSTCQNPDAAWQVLEYLVSTEEVLNMADGAGAVPSRFSALEDSELYGPGGPLEILARQLEEGRAVPRPAFAGYATLTAEFAQAVANVIAGADVQTELTRAAKAIDQDIADNDGYRTD